MSLSFETHISILEKDVEPVEYFLQKVRIIAATKALDDSVESSYGQFCKGIMDSEFHNRKRCSKSIIQLSNKLLRFEFSLIVGDLGLWNYFKINDVSQFSSMDLSKYLKKQFSVDIDIKFHQKVGALVIPTKIFDVSVTYLLKQALKILFASAGPQSKILSTCPDINMNQPFILYDLHQNDEIVYKKRKLSEEFPLKESTYTYNYSN